VKENLLQMYAKALTAASAALPVNVLSHVWGEGEFF
jgi:hypothetical protein